MMALPPPSVQDEIANSTDKLQKLYPNTFDAKKYLYLPHGKYAFAAEHTFQRKSKKELRLHPVHRHSTTYARAGVIAGHKVTCLFKTWDISKAWKEFFRELYFYSHPELLRRLQGIVVPHVIGVHHESNGQKSILMEAPNHSHWHAAHEHLPIGEKESIIRAYECLHAHGIMHNNLSFHSIFIDQDMNVTLVNFETACCLNDKGIDDSEVPLCDQEALKHEMRQVKYMIDYLGARIMERELFEASQACVSYGEQQIKPLSLFDIDLDLDLDFCNKLTCPTCRKDICIPSDMRNRPLPNDGRKRVKPLKNASQKVKTATSQRESASPTNQAAPTPGSFTDDVANSGSQSKHLNLLLTVQPPSSAVTSTPSPPLYAPADMRGFFSIDQTPLSPRLHSPLSTSFDEDTYATERDTSAQPPLFESDPEASRTLCSSRHNILVSASSSTSSLLLPARLPPPISDVPAQPLHALPSCLLVAHGASPEPSNHCYPDRPPSPKVFCDLTHEQLRLAIKQHNAAVDANLTSHPAINSDKSKVVFHPDTNDNGTYATGSDLFRKRKKRRRPTPFSPEGSYSSEDGINSDEGEEGEESEPQIEVDFEELAEEARLAKLRGRRRISRPGILPSMVPATSVEPKFPGAALHSTSILPLPALSSIGEEEGPHDPSGTPYTVVFAGANGSPNEVWQLPVPAFMYVKSLATRQPQAKKLRVEQVPCLQGPPLKIPSPLPTPRQNTHSQTSKKRKFDCVEGIEHLERTSKRTRQDSTPNSCVIC